MAHFLKKQSINSCTENDVTLKSYVCSSGTDQPLDEQSNIWREHISTKRGDRPSNCLTNPRWTTRKHLEGSQNIKLKFTLQMFLYFIRMCPIATLSYFDQDGKKLTATEDLVTCTSSFKL